MKKFKILSWNIFLGLGCPKGSFEQLLSNLSTFTTFNPDNTRSNVEKVAQLIRTEKADFIALQEIQSSPYKNRHFDQFAAIKVTLPARYGYFAPERTRQGFTSGNAVFSRVKPRINREVLLPYDIEKRNCIVTQLLVGSKTLTIVSTHLGAHWVSKVERMRQVKALGRIVAAANNPVIIVGDLNCEPSSREFRELVSITHLKPVIKSATYTALKPNKRLDHILISNEITARYAGVVDFHASDHLPVFAELSL